MKPVIIHRQARAELDEAIAFYEQLKAGLGLDVETAVERAIRRIQQNPGLGGPYKATEFRYYVARRFPYIIFTGCSTWNHADHGSFKGGCHLDHAGMLPELIRFRNQGMRDRPEGKRDRNRLTS